MARKRSKTSRSADTSALVPVERVQTSILLVRGHKVLLDEDLALIYGVPVKRLNEAVRRNIRRFPPDFLFRLSPEEFAILRSQFATSSRWGGRRYPPYAFTEHGAVMLASVLNSPRAVEASILVVRAFVRLRRFLASRSRLRAKLAELEQKLQTHDQQFAAVFDALRELMDAAGSEDARPPIGYETEEKVRKN